MAGPAASLHPTAPHSSKSCGPPSERAAWTLSRLLASSSMEPALLSGTPLSWVLLQLSTAPGPQVRCLSAPHEYLASLDHAILHWCDRVHVPGAVPLELAAAKSRGGHAETGAGAVGMRAAAMRLSCLGQLPLAHLRSLNAHVAQALDTANTVHWQAARGLGGGFAGCKVACVSAFAFQGTNAHAVLCRTAHVLRERGGNSSLLLTCSAAHLQRVSLIFSPHRWMRRALLAPTAILACAAST